MGSPFTRSARERTSAAVCRAGLAVEDPTSLAASDRVLFSVTAFAAVRLGPIIRDSQADDASGQAQWEARYTFSSTGRKVHNVMEAEFQFQGGRIAVHHDHFRFWRWSSQALGTAGLLLGWTPMVHNKVRATARA